MASCVFFFIGAVEPQLVYYDVRSQEEDRRHHQTSDSRDNCLYNPVGPNTFPSFFLLLYVLGHRIMNLLLVFSFHTAFKRKENACVITCENVFFLSFSRVDKRRRQKKIPKTIEISTFSL